MPSNKPLKSRKAAHAADGRLSRGRAREDARFPAAPPLAGLPDSYAATLEEIKQHLQQARVRAVLTANAVVIAAYWQTGQIILHRQQERGWGAKVIDRLAADLRAAFPGMAGLSPRNLLSMKLLAQAFPEGEIAKQPVSQFYHLKLRRYVVVELKARPFTPADVGQINLYLAAVDDLLRHPDDQPTIGLLLCKSKQRLVVEYALRGLDQSIAVATWQTTLTHTLPREFRGSLPTIREIEAELAGEKIKRRMPKGKKS